MIETTCTWYVYIYTTFIMVNIPKVIHLELNLASLARKDKYILDKQTVSRQMTAHGHENAT